MECKVRWTGEGMAFLAETGSNHLVAMDGAPDGGGQSIQLAGNAWDHAPPTISTASPIPNGCDISTLALPDATLGLENASLSTAECPAGRVPGQ